MFVKLFNSILKSSVWDEQPTTRIVWITFLLEADEHGFVKGVERGLARVANVTVEEFRAALQILEAPDIESQDQDYGGRRIEKVEGGWQVLNYTKYRELRTREQVREADKKRRQRERAKEADASKSLSDNAEGTAAAAAAAVVPGHVPPVPPIASASASASGSGGRGAGEGAPHAADWSDSHWRAYAALAAKHGDRQGMDALLADAHATGWRSAVLGQALVELFEAGARVSRATLIPFAKRISDGRMPPPPPAAGPVAVKRWCSSCVGTPETGHRRGCPFGVADGIALPALSGRRAAAGGVA